MLVGRENVGKTSILKCLHTFLDNPKLMKKQKPDKKKKNAPNIPLLRFVCTLAFVFAFAFVLPLPRG